MEKVIIAKRIPKPSDVVARPGLVLLRGKDGFATLKPLISRGTKIGKVK